MLTKHECASTADASMLMSVVVKLGALQADDPDMCKQLSGEFRFSVLLYTVHSW